MQMIAVAPAAEITRPRGMQLFQLQNCLPVRAMKIAADDNKLYSSLLSDLSEGY
jgi:hypothetical protein